MSGGRSLVGLVFALAAALLFAVGVALQAVEARAAPSEHVLRVSLLRRLAARPRWIAGTAAGLLGWALQAFALLFAPLTLVQPALCTGLVFLLPLGRRIRERVGRAEVRAAVLIAGGLAILSLVAPARESAHVRGDRLALALGLLAAFAVVPYVVPRRRRAPAVLLAVSAGIGYACDGLATKFFTDDLSYRSWPAACAWLTAMLSASGLATLSEMSALQRASATRVAPIVAALSTLTAVSLAPVLAHEPLPSSALLRAALGVALAAVLVGTISLARSPSVAGLLAEGEPQAPRTDGRPRVLVVTAEEGEGHTSVARALAAELVEAGADVSVHDALAASLGRIVPFFTRDAYRFQLRRLAWSYGIEYAFFTRFPPARALARAGLSVLGSRPLLRLVRAHEPDVVVTTHPTLTAVFGSLRRRHRLDVPVVAMISDFGVHPLWAHRNVDLHLVVHPSCVAAVERVAGPGSARVCRPPVDSSFREQLSKEDARAALGLPTGGTVILVSGGGWGVGALGDLARATLDLPDATVVCVTGKNDDLRRGLESSLGAHDRLRILGFTDRMAELLAGADVLVDATVGVTCLEAFERGCPIVVAGAPPGHSRDNARALERLGLATRADTSTSLPAILRRITEHGGPSVPPVHARSAASFILSAEHRPPARRPLPRLAAVASAAVLLVLALSGWTLASSRPYPLLSQVLDLRPLTAVATDRPVVGVVIDASAVGALAIDRTDMSLAVASTPQGEARPASLIPALEPLDIEHPLRARGQLERLVRALGLGESFYYLVPRRGMALADDLAARSLGGRPVSGISLRAHDPLPPGLHPGQIVILELGRHDDIRRSIARLVRDLARRHLRPSSLAQLLGARG